MSSPATIHNIAFVGHPSSGKTTLVDAVAFKMGASARKGSVADKTSICDTEPEEQEKQHTLQLATVWAEFGDKCWTLFDTPGYPEFLAEVQSAMYASDLVVGVVSGSSGATFNLRKKMAEARELDRGRAIVLTHLDVENADFDQMVHDLREGVGEECVPVLLPNASGADFADVHRTMLDPESEWYGRLKDRVMDACEDEELLMEYLETQELSEEQLDQLMPAAIASGSLVPILVCNPVNEVGINKFIEYLKRFAPTPETTLHRDADGQDIPLDPAAPLLGTVFYVHSDPHLGKICLSRIHRGTIKVSDHVTHEAGDKGEKVGGLFRLVGRKREPIESAGPGDIVAFSKVEKLGTWDSFSTGGEVPTMPTPRLPSATVALAVTPKTRADEQKIGEALTKLSAEDPSFVIEHAGDTHELVVHGMSDLHVQVMLDRMKRRYGVEVDTHIPKIAFRQTITKPAEGHHRHKKQSGGRGQFGECFMRLRPAPEGEGIVFKDAVVGGSIPRNLIPAVEKGIREIAASGILCDGTVVDVEAELYDGKFHAVDSDEASFKMAGARAFREGFMSAGPVLLEPIMKVLIRVPTSDAGTVFSDITSHRRGHVLDQGNEDDGAITVIEADVPLMLMQTYFRDLKSQTSGEGNFSMEFSRYAPLPGAEQKKVLADIGKQHDDD